MVEYTGVRAARISATDRMGVATWLRIAESSKGAIPGGLKYEMITRVDNPDRYTIAGTIANLEMAAAAGALIGAEGPNEPGNDVCNYKGIVGCKKAPYSWVPLAMFQRDFYIAVHADPKLKGVPVFCPSEVGDEFDDVGLQFAQIPENWVNAAAMAQYGLTPGVKYCDKLNAHNYVDSPSQTLYNNAAWNCATKSTRAHPGCDSLENNNGPSTWAHHYAGYSASELPAIPAVTTETGWRTGPSNRRPSIDQYSQGVILLNVWLSQFKRGFDLTCQYEMADGYGSPGETFGMFDHDFKPKLSATFLHNFTSILHEPAVSYNPRTSLYYAVSNPPPYEHDMLLERSDGALFLAVWDENIPENGQTDTVKVNLGEEVASVVEYDPTVGTEPVMTLKKVSEVPLSMTDHVLILQINKLQAAKIHQTPPRVN